MRTWQSNPGQQPVLIMALDGFLSVGESASIISRFLNDREKQVLHTFDLDDYLDYRSRRPPIGFNHDHFHDLQLSPLQICGSWDDNDVPFLFLTGPEPDMKWERFSEVVINFMIEHDVAVLFNLTAVPMAVPHTRPVILTSHGTVPELVDRENIFKAEIYVPSSAQTFTEFRCGEAGLQAAGYVAHVPHYVAQQPFPPAAISLLSESKKRLGLDFDLGELQEAAEEALNDLSDQVEQSNNEVMLAEMERQYDDMTRTDPNSLLNAGPIPSAEDLAKEFEQYLATRDKRGESD